MRFPYHLFLKYLLLTKHTDQEVRDLFRQTSDRDVSTAYLNRIRQELLASNDPDLRAFLTAPHDPAIVKLHRQDIDNRWVEWIDAEEMHHATEDFQVAYKCFTDHRKRNYLSVYSLCVDIDPERLLTLFKSRFGEDLTGEQLLLFVKYFADFEAMSPADWERFMDKMSPKLKLLYRAAPGRQVPYIQWKMGDTVELDPKTVNHSLMSDFYFLARDEYVADIRHDGWADRSAKFANIALSAGDRVKNSGTQKRAAKQLIMLFREEEGEIATYEDVNTGDDPPGPNVSGGVGPGDSED